MENTRLKPTHVSHITTSQQLLLTQFILQTLFELCINTSWDFYTNFFIHRYL